MNQYEEMSMIEIAEMIMSKKKHPEPIRNIIKEVLALKGLDENDGNMMAQLYIDITISSKFVFCGEDKWDLKEKQSLSLWDSDGSEFNPKEEVEEDKDIVIDDEDIKPIKEEDEDEEDEEEEEIEIVTLEEDEGDEDEVIYDNDDDYDEDKYNNIMDDYEDLYDK